MVSRYIPVIQQTLQLKYPQRQHQQQVRIQNIRFKLFLSKTSSLFASFKQLKILSFNHCDLRNLQNFPKLSLLQELDLGFNQIQGTFNYLIPLKRLKYLNIENNIVFESSKLAPLKKITTFSRSGLQTTSKATLSICVRNNPFTTEETAFVNKLKGYALKVVKEPNEYLNKKKNDQGKGNNHSGQKGSKKKRSKGESGKKEKKVKKIKFEELDSFYSSEQEINDNESQDSSSDSEHNNNRNSILMNHNPTNIHHSRPPHIQNRLISHHQNLESRLAVRLSAQSHHLQQLRNYIDNPFNDSGDNIIQNQLSQGGMLVLEDYDSSEMENRNAERQRNYDERIARLRQLRRDRLEFQRDRRRILGQQRIREREERQSGLFRHLEEGRQRHQHRSSIFSRPNTIIYGSMRNNSNTNPPEEDFRLNSFRRRPSGASGVGVVQRIAESINNDQSNQGSDILSRRRPLSYRSYLQRVQSLDRSSLGQPNLNLPIYHPLHVRQSSDLPGIISLSRGESYASMNSQRSNQLNMVQEINRESSQQGIRFQVNSDSVSESIDDQDNDDNDDDDENDLLNEDEDDDEIDQMMRDDEEEEEQDEEEDEMIHACDAWCEHNQPQPDQEDQDDQKDDDNQNNQQDNEDNGQILDFFMLNGNDMIQPMVIDRLEVIEDEREMRPMIRLSQRENPSSSSNLNDQSVSNLDEEELQHQEEESLRSESNL